MSSASTRSSWIVPVLGLVATLVLTALVAPEILTGSVSDVGTFVRVAGSGGVIALWVMAFGRVMSGWVGALVRFVPVAFVLGWVLAPYVGAPTVVNEEFPIAAVAATTSVRGSTTAAPEVASTSAPVSASSSAPPHTIGVTSTEPRSAASSTPPTTAAPAPAPPTTLPPTTRVAQPLLVSSGAFQGLTGHRGRGNALVYDLADGSVLLRLEEIDIGSGPALEIYLVPGRDQRGLSNAVHVAALKGEQGNQNYDVPAGIDPAIGDWTVLVWCETFAVEVANATLA